MYIPRILICSKLKSGTLGKRVNMLTILYLQSGVNLLFQSL